MSETFGRYAVIRQLGRGAMGVVYLASDPMLNRQVAVKTVDLSVEEPEEREFLRERLFRDARAAAVLKHPNIVAIYDVFEDAGRAYVVMEFIEGDSLAARLKNKPMSDASAMLKILSQMADALDYTHARGVIHRDIKPANVMIDSTGTTKIMDFGIARISDARTCTPTGMVMGTVEYMAPEQILGEAADGRADQFALAVVAYQMMTGSTLYGPNTVATLTYKIVHETPVLPSTRNGSLPRGVDAVLAKALAKQPAGRFGTCKEFVGALATAFSDAPTGPLAAPTGTVATLRTQTTIDLPASRTLVEPAGHSRAPVVVAAIAVVLLAGALAAVIWKPWVHTPEGPAATGTATATGPTETKSAAKSPGTAPVREPASKKNAGAAADKSGTAAQTPEPVEAEMPVIPPDPKNKSAPSPYMQAMKHGEQQIKESDWMGAISSFGNAIALRPDAAQAHYMRGTVYQHVDQFDNAMRDYTEAIHLEPKMVMAYTGLGGCYAHEQRDNEALVEFQRALELNPNAPLALFGRGNVYYRRKDYRRALADYNRVLEINPLYAPAYQNRAHAKEALGDVAGAAADKRTEQSLRKQE